MYLTRLSYVQLPRQFKKEPSSPHILIRTPRSSKLMSSCFSWTQVSLASSNSSKAAMATRHPRLCATTCTEHPSCDSSSSNVAKYWAESQACPPAKTRCSAFHEFGPVENPLKVPYLDVLCFCLYRRFVFTCLAEAGTGFRVGFPLPVRGPHEGEDQSRLGTGKVLCQLSQGIGGSYHSHKVEAEPMPWLTSHKSPSGRPTA